MSKVVELRLPLEVAKYIRDTFSHGSRLYGKAGDDIVDIIDNATIVEGEPSKGASKVVHTLPEEGL